MACQDCGDQMSACRVARCAVALGVSAPVCRMRMHPCQAFGHLIDDGRQLNLGAEVVIHHNGGHTHGDQCIGQITEITFVTPTPIAAMQKDMQRCVGCCSLEHIQRGQGARPVTQVVNAGVALPCFKAELLGAGSVLVHIAHGMAGVELGFNIGGMHWMPLKPFIRPVCPQLGLPGVCCRCLGLEMI